MWGAERFTIKWAGQTYEVGNFKVFGPAEAPGRFRIGRDGRASDSASTNFSG
jgi:hypothetical protein